jgi:hypothetical protein
VTSTSISLLLAVVGLLLTVVGSLAGIMVSVWLSQRDHEPRLPQARPHDAPTRKRKVAIVCLVLGGLAALVLRTYRLRR